MTAEERLDFTPFSFGKHKGKTPEQVASLLKDYSWLVWAYETIKDKPVCSAALYRDCKKHLKAERGEREYDDEAEEEMARGYGYMLKR